MLSGFPDPAGVQRNPETPFNETFRGNESQTRLLLVVMCVWQRVSVKLIFLPRVILGDAI